MLEKAPDDF